jgi:hypothetical protein
MQGVFSNAVFMVDHGLPALHDAVGAHRRHPARQRLTKARVVAGGASPARSPASRWCIPFDLGNEDRFNVFYWLISVVILFYGMRAWQGDQGYNAAARTPHEAKMANILNGWRFRVLMLVTLVLPICIRTLLHHPAYTPSDAAMVQEAAEAACATESAAVRSCARLIALSAACCRPACSG